MLEREGEPARLEVDAEARRLADPVRERDVEHLHVHLADVASHPLLEDVDEELPVLLATDRAARDDVAVLHVERPIAPRRPPLPLRRRRGSPAARRSRRRRGSRARGRTPPSPRPATSRSSGSCRPPAGPAPDTCRRARSSGGRSRAPSASAHPPATQPPPPAPRRAPRSAAAGTSPAARRPSGSGYPGTASPSRGRSSTSNPGCTPRPWALPGGETPAEGPTPGVRQAELREGASPGGSQNPDQVAQPLVGWSLAGPAGGRS